MIHKQYETNGKYWDPMGSILPTVKKLLNYRCMFATKLTMLKKTRKEEVGEFIDNCREISWVEEEVKKWMTKQAIRYLRLEDNDRPS